MLVWGFNRGQNASVANWYDSFTLFSLQKGHVRTVCTCLEHTTGYPLLKESVCDHECSDGNDCGGWRAYAVYRIGEHTNTIVSVMFMARVYKKFFHNIRLSQYAQIVKPSPKLPNFSY